MLGLAYMSGEESGDDAQGPPVDQSNVPHAAADPASTSADAALVPDAPAAPASVMDAHVEEKPEGGPLMEEDAAGGSKCLSLVT